MAKPKRTPVKSSAKPKRTPKTKVKADPAKEYAEHLKGTGVVEALTFSDDDCIAHVKRHISTGSLALDRLLNGKGVPCGRITEIFGPPHIGKSTVLDQLFASVQRENGIAVLADVESSRDRNYTGSLGVNPDKLHYLSFDDQWGKGDDHEEGKGSTVEAVTIAVARSIEFWKEKYPEMPVVIGWDSLGSTKTREEATKDFGATRSPGAAARVMRMFQRQIPELLGGTNIALVVLNHEYQKIQTGPGNYAGPKKETYGGEALRLAASIRMQLYGTGDTVKRSDGTILGKFVTAKLLKNRLGPSPVEQTFALLNGTGVNNVIEVYEQLKKKGIIQVSGSWSALNLDGEVFNFQGWAGLNDKCLENPTLFQKLVSVYQGTL